MRSDRRHQARFDTGDIRDYYERHTSAFVRFGQGGGAIHRAVWGPGVTTREQAFHFVEDRVGSLIAHAGATATPHVVDLGCGVGASLCYLARRHGLRGTGVTVSPTQVAMARARIAAAGLVDRVECIEADFANLPPTVAPADLAYAIESFVHGPSPGRFFEQAAALVRPGGLLAICDDVRRAATSSAAERAVEEFVSGWHVNSLVDRESMHALATSAGFEQVETVDLTPWLEIGRARDRILSAFLSVAASLGFHRARVDYAVGGRALQTCLANGWVGYELAVFRRAGLTAV
jgi:cyclopropane fatty-acyl-phospholipid synthase-like methyltransferase